jgi:uncharacterized protein (DUF1330 family)
MTPYVVIDRLTVTDPDAFSAYLTLAPPAAIAYGGRYVLPHGTQIETLEGKRTWSAMHRHDGGALPNCVGQCVGEFLVSRG